jgi:hypothetical protein
MSGWDTPSRPTWDPQDGPEDGTQAFSQPDASVDADDPWTVPSGSGWGTSSQPTGPDFGRAGYGGSDLGASGFGGGATGGHASGGPDSGGPGAGDAFGGPPPEFFTEEFERRTPGASLGRSAEMPSWDLPVRGGNGRGRNGTGANGTGDQPSAWEQSPAWGEPQWQDAHRQDFSRQDDYDRQDPGRQEFGRQEFGRQNFGREDFGREDFGREDFGGQGFGSQDPIGQDLARRQPGLSYSDAQPGYAAQPGYPAQPDQSDQLRPPAGHQEEERGARTDPALQDFFSPTASGPRYGPRPGQGRRELEAPRGSQSPQAPGRPADPWDEPAAYQSSGPQRSLDRPGSRGPAGSRAGSGSGGGVGVRDSSDGIRPSRILAVGAVVAVVVAAGAYLLLHKPAGSSAANDTAPTVAASTGVPTPTTSAKANVKAKANVNSRGPGGATAGGYVLSAPSVAGGYPLGSDPHFLATTAATAATIEKSAVSGNGGTVTGKPVSASYTLPAEQTIEFVGYQGTFNPKTVMTNLKAFGTTEATYSPGPHGGEMACANVPATATAASGGVCVWVTATTLGVTEFFTQTGGPEVLTVAQSKGAADTLALRASVETRKS